LKALQKTCEMTITEQYLKRNEETWVRILADSYMYGKDLEQGCSRNEGHTHAQQELCMGPKFPEHLHSRSLRGIKNW
jgi:hypothetical protein